MEETLLKNKLKKLRKQLQEVTNLEQEIRDEFPDKDILLIYRSDYHYNDHWRIVRYHLREEAEEHMRFVIGGMNPKSFTYFITRVI